ncbi:GNAT family N-acetyltransferase [Microvirga lenta]|uniref:GNAT family N-acetyltransferase n=1 Tax=Microvirga lenta TaxID=2881337 RepID=UPI001CFF356D|nr:GNAT family N-acetyltransferase [Microvirga lenta]MCB5173885.1 GNAT family N-acetyltransferase [Microvirga lenta]
MTGSSIYPWRSSVDLIRGEMAGELLINEAFEQAWSALVKQCPWSTACQSPGFAEAWFAAYIARFEPLLIVEHDEVGRLIGLLPLAIERASGKIVHVGAEQAEYQVWIATDLNSTSFIEAALDVLASDFPGCRLHLQYLPPGSPVQWCNKARHNSRAFIVEKKRPVLTLGPGSSVEDSLRKKSNKSRINRLRKTAPLSLVEVRTRSELERYIDSIAEYCDLRQGAINSSLPFKEDPQKREFCLKLLEKPGIAHVSILKVGDAVAAANIGLISRTSVSVGVLAHSPFLAEHSPGKILILLLAQTLGRQGLLELDLTPGGDMYKDRSADHYDQVYVLSVHLDRFDFLWHWLRVRIRAAATQALGRHGQALSSYRKQISRYGLRGLLPDGLLRSTYRTGRLPIMHFNTVSLERARQISSRNVCNINCISDLLCYEPESRNDRSKMEFLLAASQRLEAGDRAYTIVEGGVLLHCSWLSLPKSGHKVAPFDTIEAPLNSCVLLDDYTHPEARKRGLAQLSLEQRLADAAAEPNVETILVPADADAHSPQHEMTPRNELDDAAIRRAVSM